MARGSDECPGKAGQGAGLRRLLTVLALGAALTGCMTTTAFVREGDADSVSVGYGEDVAAAWPLARRHCAQFSRVPRLVDAGLNIANFKCERP